jgi:hypothetical protein
MIYDEQELTAFVLFTTGAISDGIAYIIYNMITHAINDPSIQEKIRSEVD